jgi:hypothetical protein
MAGEGWAPGLSDVARHVPRRTRDRTTPGTDKLLMTFNVNTTPAGDAVQQMIDDVVGGLLATSGDLPTSVTQAPEISKLARTFVEWRVAADIELAYPNRDADVQVYRDLDARAQAEYKALGAALALADAGSSYEVAGLPLWGFPDPPAYGDESPGSGTVFVWGGSRAQTGF